MPPSPARTDDAPLALDALAEHDDVEAIDVETARLMRRLDPEGGGAVEAAALLLSMQRRAGAACVRLGDWAGRNLWAGRTLLEGEGRRLPALPDWRAALAASPLVGDESAPASDEAEATPLVCSADGERLYLYRWWRAERTVARLLRHRADAEPAPLPAAARDAFGRLFETKTDDQPATGQAVAAAGALFSPLTVVTGGPGTGKTYAAARLLALLLTARPGLEVALAAPTGKAAKRLGDSIAREAATLDLPDAVRRAMPLEAQTLHRLLGYQPQRNRFRFHGGRPLAGVDAVLVDESSMIDLLLFQALLEALPERARLIFMGDEHQLASIGAGRVLADLAALRGTGRTPAFARYCRRLGAGRVPISEKGPSLRDSVTTLRTTYRFDERSGVAALAGAIRDGEADRAVGVLRSGDFPDVRLVAPSDRHGAPRKEVHPGSTSSRSFRVLGETVAHARRLCRAGSAEAALAHKQEAQVLAATYHGPWGVRAVNRFVEDALLRSGDRAGGRFYPGRPVLVTANDYEQRLFNGDQGVCFSEGGRLRAFFEGADEDAPRAIPPARLPPHESAYAVTVHKSQGSEYGEVTLLLPAEMRPPLCRELVYTAVTRAKKRVTVVGPEAVLRAALAAPERRPSGLGEALRGTEAP